MMIETYCAECRDVRVLPELEPLTCCECDGVLEIQSTWNQEGK
jgi:hypothetical protein